jgi:cytochrome c553
MKKLLLILASVGVVFGSNCAMCHNGSYKSKLDIYTPQEIIDVMNEYKNGERSGTMSAIVRGMDEKEIKNSAYKYGKK